MRIGSEHRETRTKRGYDNRWLRASKAFRRQNPLCAWCLRRGRPVSATCVDHVIPHQRDQVLFWDYRNWQSLCNTCHARKSLFDATGRVVDWHQSDVVTVVCGVAEFPNDVVIRSLRQAEAWLPMAAAKHKAGEKLTIFCDSLMVAFDAAKRLKAGLVIGG